VRVDLPADDAFWANQAGSLAVFVGADRVRTFRLADRLQARVEDADRFHVKPLLLAVTLRHEAFVLALSQDAVRLVEVTADLPPATVRVPELPRDLADAVGRGSLDSRSPGGRIQGSEGEKVRPATFGAVAAIAVDDEDGGVTFAPAASAATHGVVDEIAGRVFTSGGRVLALRRDEVPGRGDLAAVLRYAP
jgi:hypothetical protein